jgi:hypothetical protein
MGVFPFRGKMYCGVRLRRIASNVGQRGMRSISVAPRMCDA